jgi:hypothetical protein
MTDASNPSRPRLRVLFGIGRGGDRDPSDERPAAAPDDHSGDCGGYGRNVVPLRRRAPVTNRRKLRARLRELDAMIAARSQWGAALTALNEERNGILAALAGYQDT